MIGWIVRALMIAGGVLTGWIIARDAPLFGVVQIFVTLFLMALIVALVRILATGGQRAAYPLLQTTISRRRWLRRLIAALWIMSVKGCCACPHALCLIRGDRAVAHAFSFQAPGVHWPC